MPLGGEWVTVDSHFAQYARDVDRAAERALGQAASVTVAVARSKATGYNIGTILGSIKAWPVIRTPGGWQIHILASDFRELFFELGTLGRRKRRVKRRTLPTHTKDGHLRGIKPGYFLVTGAHAGKTALMEALRRALP